ncbi:MAG: copper amine oxidase N-terminal domain-containing protein [Clostridia bacterium]|nr:copper amine oxidase N-terminal domain-containing protein [Clostridia bacterium]
MKKIFALLLTLAIAFSCVMFVGAEDDVTVKVNGVVIEFDVPPQIINGRTMVPMRKVFEVLGANVEWVGEMRLAVATYKTTIISMRIDEYSFSLTDVITGETEQISLDVPAMIVGNRTLIPLRAVSEALGKTVKWDADTRTAIITG